MKLTPVKSSNLAAVGYDNIQNILFVQFHNGGVWSYQGVPVETYELMKSADSIGSFYAKHIKRNILGAPVQGEAKDV